MKLPLPSRIPIVYLVVILLITVGVVPLYFYAIRVVENNRDTLSRNEKLLQNSVTIALAETIAQREKDIRAALASVAYSVQLTTGGNFSSKRMDSPRIQD